MLLHILHRKFSRNISAFGTFHADLRVPSATGFNDFSICTRTFMAHEENHRDDGTWFEEIEHVFRQHCFSHTRLGQRANAVRENVFPSSFKSTRFCEAHDATLRGGIVHLPEVAVHASSRRHVHDSTKTVLYHVRPSSLSALVDTFEMHGVNEVPIIFGHLGERNIPKDTSIVDEDVHSAKGLNSRLDDFVSIFHRIVICLCRCTHCTQFLHNHVGGPCARTAATVASTQIVHHHFRAALRKSNCIGLS
mmetsp:Transcript_4242/g.11996  ORF Transcript_4242/g.11996 Transcript_4242/m.11996 type:complete len:249 (-) Transcript_4242:110-856(-)